nr:Beta-barrel assembly-enhancing protease [Candidatus Anoxychlamydiales bacterium]
TDSKIKITAKKVFDVFKEIYDFIYAKNPVTQKRQLWFIPTSFEKSAGSWMYASYVVNEGGKTFDEKNSKLVQQIGQDLTKKTKRGLSWQFTQIRSPKINALCLPGGKICIYDGIIEGIEKVNIKGYADLSKEDKIAAVLAHEIIHAEARHAARKIEKLFVINLILIGIKICTDICINVFRANADEKQMKKDKVYLDITKFVTDHLTTLFTKLYILAGSRSHEYEADKYGMYLMKDNGYNPKAALWLQEFFITRELETSDWIKKVYEIFSTHPAAKNRLEKNRETLNEIEEKKSVI